MADVNDNIENGSGVPNSNTDTNSQETSKKADTQALTGQNKELERLIEENKALKAAEAERQKKEAEQETEMLKQKEEYKTLYEKTLSDLESLNSTKEELAKYKQAEETRTKNALDSLGDLKNELLAYNPNPNYDQIVKFKENRSTQKHGEALPKPNTDSAKKSKISDSEYNKLSFTEKIKYNLSL